MSLIPAGVSKKTSKPYNAFWKCESGVQDHTIWLDFPKTEPANAVPTAEPKPSRSAVIADNELHKAESMRILNAKNGAASIVAALIQSSQLKQCDVEVAFDLYCNHIWNFKPRGEI
jgi:hypothetical protein